MKDHLGSNRVVLRDDGQILERNHYNPSGQRFGESIVLGGSVQPYRHTGHEMQAMHGLNWIDNGARMRTVYDGGSFTTADPLCEKRPWESPYCYAGGNPMRFVDPDGRYPYPIAIRSFAPFKSFGGGFTGDNRGFSTSASVTSRLAQSFIMNTDNHTYSGLHTGSSQSSHPLLGTATASDDKGSISNFVYSNNKDGSTTTSWTSTMEGHNPLVPGSPDIDAKTNFSLTENKAAGTLGVSVTQTGDAFPSAETMIGDTKGNMLMIGVSPAIGNPYTSLPGDGNKSMMSANFTVTMDGKGVFTGVQIGGKTYSVGDWNKMMQATPAVAPTNTGNQQKMNDMMDRGHKE